MKKTDVHFVHPSVHPVPLHRISRGNREGFTPVDPPLNPRSGHGQAQKKRRPKMISGLLLLIDHLIEAAISVQV